MDIALLTDRSQLQGTAYYEFARGADTNTHWNAGSVFVHMDVFELIESVIAKTVVGFNPYGPTTLSGGRAVELAAALKDFGRKIGQAATPEDVFGPTWPNATEEVRSMPWEALKRDLTRLTGDLRKWLDDTAASGSQITVLGI